MKVLIITNILVGYGCGSPAMTQRSRYHEEAYKLGRSL